MQHRFIPLEMRAIPALHEALWQAMSPIIQTQIRLHHTLKLTAHERTWGVMVMMDEAYIGYGQLTRWGNVGEISDLIITPAYRNLGIGTALIRHLAHIALSNGMITAEIGVDVANISARRLYERLGFVQHRVLKSSAQPIIYLRCDMSTLQNP